MQGRSRSPSRTRTTRTCSRAAAPLLGQRGADGGARVVAGLVEDAVEAVAVGGIVRLEEAERQVVIDFVARLEVQPAPIDDRAAAQDEPDPLEIAERPLVGQR